MEDYHHRQEQVPVFYRGTDSNSRTKAQIGSHPSRGTEEKKQRGGSRLSVLFSYKEQQNTIQRFAQAQIVYFRRMFMDKPCPP